MDTYVFEAIDAMRRNGYGNGGNFEKFVGGSCVIKPNNRRGFVVMTKEYLWDKVKEEVTNILNRECPSIKIVSIEQDSKLFFSGDLFVQLVEE